MTLPTEDIERRLRDLLEDYWSQLADRAVTVPDGLRATDLPVHVPAGQVRVAVDSAGERHLLVPVDVDAVGVEDHRSESVSVSTKALSADDLAGHFVDVHCSRADLSPVFAAFAADVCLELLSSGHAPERVVAEKLNSWREFFEEASRRWTRQRLAGLFAELRVLRSLLRIDAGAVESWVGPSGQAHDFRSLLHAVEVKASTSREGRLVRIHGVDQLERPASGSLFLVWLRVAAVPTHQGETVSQLVEDCRVAAAPASVDRRLALLGLRTPFPPELSNTGFVVLEERCYEVGDAFPAVTPTSFATGAAPAGVSGVEYTVDLDVVPPDGMDLRDVLRRFLAR